MYKVFSGAKKILLTVKPIEGNGRIAQCNSSEKLITYYNDFCKGTEDNIQFISNDLGKTWNDFLSIFTVITAAGGLVKNEKDDLLMIYRNNQWDLPKGKIEKGEKTENAAVREVEEECGISKPKIIRPLIETYHIYQLHRMHMLKKTYWFEMHCNNYDTLTPQISEGIVEAKWLNKEAVRQVLPHAYPSIREVIKEANQLL